MQKKEERVKEARPDPAKIKELEELLFPIEGTCPYCHKLVQGDLALEIHIKRCAEMEDLEKADL